MPVYNVERYLAKCIDSILNSSYPDFELILINDGSKDNSLKICQDYQQKDKRIQVIDQKNQGASVARNKGIQASLGEWIVFVDADDFISSDFLSLVAAQKKADLLLFDFEKSNLEKPVKKALPPIEIALDQRENKVNLIEKLFLYQQILPQGHSELRAPWAKAFRKSLLDRYGIYFTPNLKVGEDALFNIEVLCRANSCFYIPTCVYYHTICLDSMTHRFVPGLLDSFSLFQRGMKEVLLKEDLFFDLERAYMANTLENMAYLLIKGIFNPYSPNSWLENLKLCQRMQEDKIYEQALTYNYKIGNLARRILLGLFQAKRYRLVKSFSQMCFICLEQMDKRQAKIRVNNYGG